MCEVGACVSEWGSVMICSWLAIRRAGAWPFRVGLVMSCEKLISTTCHRVMPTYSLGYTLHDTRPSRYKSQAQSHSLIL